MATIKNYATDLTNFVIPIMKTIAEHFYELGLMQGKEIKICIGL